ncbi:unnamed protein product [Closterium sp. NIES-54]
MYQNLVNSSIPAGNTRHARVLLEQKRLPPLDSVTCDSQRARGREAMGRGGRDDLAEDSQRLLGTPVYVNVYDLTRYNDVLYWLGLGVFHSGLEVHGVEYAFGAHDQACSGVFELPPRCAPGFLFRTSIPVGTTTLSPLQVTGGGGWCVVRGG